MVKFHTLDLLLYTLLHAKTLLELKICFNLRLMFITNNLTFLKQISSLIIAITLITKNVCYIYIHFVSVQISVF